MFYRHVNYPAILAKQVLGESEENGWIAVDLDGTLAKYTGWKGLTHIGEPVPKMVARVRRWVGHGKKVKIFTARADDEKSVNAIKKWLKKNDLPDLEITNLKDKDCVEIWDDRAVGLKKNTGEVKEEKVSKKILAKRALMDPHAAAVDAAGGKHIRVGFNRAKWNARLAAYAPGCGSPTRVSGTNGGEVPCGAKVNGETVFCPHCAAT